MIMKMTTNKKIIFLSGIILLSLGCSTDGVRNYNEEEGNQSFELETEVEGAKIAPKKTSPVTSTFDKPETNTPKQSSGALEKRFESAVNTMNEDQMIAAGSELLARNPENTGVLNGFGVFYIKHNQPDAAKIYFQRVLVKDPKNADANNGMGVIAMTQGNELEGQAYFKKSLLGDNDHVGANANLGTFYLKYLDYDKALGLLENAYKEDRSNGTIANNYAVALRGVGKIDRALSVYKSIDSKNQKVPVLLNQAILWAEFKKDNKEAKELLNKVRFITTDPGILKKVNALTKKLDQEVK